MPTSRANVDATTALGATPIAGGATFRLWAPCARQVFVLSGPALQEAGRPGFSPSPDDAMFPLDDGTWAAFVAGLGDGAAYRFFVVGTGSAGLKRDPRARELGIDPPYPNCDCLIRATDTYPWHDDDFRPPPFNRLIQYQLHVGVYYAVDANGNDKRRSIGRFLDLLDRVEYLRDLGINAIQLLPIQEFATPTSRDYNGVDLFSPEMDYQVEGPELARYLDKANRLLGDLGKPALSPAELEPGPNQLKCVIDIFHLHGIAVMVDLVFNHAGPGFNDQSLWFLDRQPEGDDNRSLYFTDHEWVGGRAFAYWQAPVRQFLIDNARQCIEEYHADGIRYDEVTVIAANGGGSLCQDLSSTIRFERPETIQIAEYWGGEREVAVRPAPFGFGFDAAWSDRLRDAVRRAISAASGGRDAFVDIEDLARAYDTPAGFGAAWRAVNFLEDHDTVFNGRSPRIARLADPRDARSWFARGRARVGLGLLLAARGNPMIFMGQEILEDKPWDDTVGGHADLFVWWDGLKTDAVMRDYLQFCRDLLWLRRREPALSSEQLHVSTQNGLDRVIAIHRWVENAGNDLLVVANLQELNRYGYRVGFPAGGPWREIFNSDAYDTMPNPAAVGNGGRVTADDLPWDGMPASSAITLPANGFIIFAR